MSTLYLRLPSKALAEGAENRSAVYCKYALVSTAGRIEQEGVSPLSELTGLASRARQVVAILAASDVTLLRIQVPRMPAAKLRAALPNLVEDQLMTDPEDCTVVAGDTVDGLLTVAVVQRQWMELVGRSLTALGARKFTAVPAQLCLPVPDEGITAAIVDYGSELEVAVRLDSQQGLGLPVFAEQPELAPTEALQALSALAPAGPITLLVPESHAARFNDASRMAPPLQERVRLEPDNWGLWIAGADRVPFDLMARVDNAARRQLNWRLWRWPVALAALLLLVNIVALNIDWLRMRREATALQATMVQTYKSAFPKETVIIDPLTQMRQKIASAQRGTGQIAPDDFIALAAAFSEAWGASGQGPQVIAGVDYRDRGLSVKFKPGSNVSPDQVKQALASRKLALSEPSAGVWQIRRAQ